MIIKLFNIDRRYKKPILRKSSKKLFTKNLTGDFRFYLKTNIQGQIWYQNARECIGIQKRSIGVDFVEVS